MVSKKGAFQLSLSFIIMVVFAVIVLSLAIAWIQGMFEPLTSLTHSITDVARSELLDRIASSDSRVGIAAPDVSAWSRGETGSYAVGVKNTHADKDQTFSMNVYLEEIGGELAGKGVEAYANAARKWLTFSTKIFVESSGSETTDIVIQPPTNAEKGIYMFRIVVCEALSCTNLDSPNLYGSQQFTLEIKG
ncbi:hypothetical protein ACFLQO_00735 [Candidatus Aenigmatarchaeota archaeon]